MPLGRITGSFTTLKQAITASSKPVATTLLLLFNKYREQREKDTTQPEILGKRLWAPEKVEEICQKVAMIQAESGYTKGINAYHFSADKTLEEAAQKDPIYGLIENHLAEDRGFFFGSPEECAARVLGRTASLKEIENTLAYHIASEGSCGTDHLYGTLTVATKSLRIHIIGIHAIRPEGVLFWKPSRLETLEKVCKEFIDKEKNA